MKAALLILPAALAATCAALPVPGAAQNVQNAQTQYYAHRQLTNPAAMSEAAAVEAALYGQYRLYGFDGAPKEMALQVTAPFSIGAGAERSSRYFADGSSDREYRNMFFGFGAYGANVGAYSEYSALLSYAYQVRLSRSVQLAFGVALGASVSGRRYGATNEDAVDPTLVSSSLWQFHSQAGAYLHGDKYYVSVYSPAAVDKAVFLQAGYSAAVGRSSDEGGYYDEARQKKSTWEVHAQAGWQKDGKLSLQGSTLYTINNLLGVGVAWQNPLNLAALAQLQIGGVKICYAYQITDLNVNVLQHEVMLKITFAKKENLY
ncbi:MAG: type IX secretion system membrane protein PorP/SprF [Prevotellaceae bacterium]|nr:type IX secretion system membrane protein PorP/SprF [Prevotellaceae bacterium]